MAKRQRRPSSRRAKSARRQTNWLLIGGIILGAVVVIGLLALALREPEPFSLTNFCQNNPNHCITKGAADAPVTVVEISDYGCSHCRDFNLQSADSIDQQYVQTGQVKWIALPYALSSTTVPAAESALCAAEQDTGDNFFVYHKQMFEIQQTQVALTPAGFLESAGQAGLDLEAFNTCIESDKYATTVQENIRAAGNAGVAATPTFFINGVKIEGDNPTGIVNEIENQLANNQ